MRTFALRILMFLAGVVHVFGGRWVEPRVSFDLVQAQTAGTLLAPAFRTQVIEIENTGPGRYPPRAYVTVFEFTDVLWIYFPSEGTQSLSLQRGRVEEDWTNLLPLLREVDPGFVAYQQVSTAHPNSAKKWPRLENACFIKSVLELNRRMEGGERIVRAELLALYYSDKERGIIGHTGLLIENERGLFFWDPERPVYQRRIPKRARGSELAIARFVSGEAEGRLLRARTWPANFDATRQTLHAQAPVARRARA